MLPWASWAGSSPSDCSGAGPVTEKILRHHDRLRRSLFCWRRDRIDLRIDRRRVAAEILRGTFRRCGIGSFGVACPWCLEARGGLRLYAGRFDGGRRDRSSRLQLGYVLLAQTNAIGSHICQFARAPRLVGGCVRPVCVGGLNAHSSVIVPVQRRSLVRIRHAVSPGGSSDGCDGLRRCTVGSRYRGLFSSFSGYAFSGTLVQSHETRRKKEAGTQGKKRGADAAALEAAGAGLGSIGLRAFAATMLLVTVTAPWGSLALASLVWMATAAGCWWNYKRLRSLRM